MIQKGSQTHPLQAQNMYCVYCLLMEDEWVEATHLIWDEGEQKAMPLCDECMETFMVEDKFFLGHSVN